MKKRILAIVMATAVCISAVGCSKGVSQEEHESVKTELSGLQSENDELKKEKQSVEKEKESSASELKTVKAEYESYKERMSPYETLEAADAEARIRELEESKAAESEAKAQAEAEEQARQEEEAAKGYETGITYDQLARTPDDYKGQKVKFYGKVIQVVEGDTETDIRLAVDDNYDTVLYCGYAPSIVTSRILDDDYITIYGSSLGLYSYTSTMGGKITIPSVWVDKVDQ